ncbi:MAG: hypothetical protein IT443_06865 [Phycisphaeraceae bacterium]|nr:hypothetical protein [Phycisphaeraceae bacterium]
MQIRRPLIRLGLFFLVVILLLTTCRGVVAYRSHAALVRYRAAGHPTTLAEYEAKYPAPPPPARNGWNELEEAGRPFREAADAKVHSLITPVSIADIPPAGQPWPTDIHQKAEEYLAGHAQALAQARQALAADYFLRPFRPSLGLEAMPSARWHRNVAQLLAIEHALHRDQWSTDRQIQAFADSLKLANTLHDDPAIISVLIQISEQAQTLIQLRWIFQACSLTEQQLEQIDSLLAAIPNSHNWERAYEGETLVMLTVIDTLWPDNSQMRFITRVSPLNDISRASYLRTQLAMFDAIAQSDPRRQLEQIKMVGQEIDQLGFLQAKAGMVVGSPTILISSHKLNMSVQSARVAVALERYRLHHQSYPATLDQLVPDYLAQVPLDAFADNPQATLKYRQFDDGYVVYSVGDDGKDDGGVTNPFNVPASSGYDPGFEVRRAPTSSPPAQTQPQNQPPE